MSRNLIKSAGILLFLIVVPLVAIDMFSSKFLFEKVSYTNSEKFDVSMASLQKIGPEVNAFAIGSSEILYGFNPEVFDEYLKSKSCNITTFNLGVEGFGPTHYEILLKHMPVKKWMPNSKIAFVGVNMIELHDSIPNTVKGGFDCKRMAGDLQRSIYTSSFGKDFKLELLCEQKNPVLPFAYLNKAFEKVSSAYRYRRALRSYLLKGSINKENPDRARNQAKVNKYGFYRSGGMSDESYAFHVNRWRTNFSQTPYWQKPLDPQYWPRYMENGGIFDRLATYLTKRGLVPIFVANATNPMMIHDTHREAAYKRNAQLLNQWTKNRGYGFLDAGILDGYDKKIDFEDHRHISGPGSEKYTLVLAKQFYKNYSQRFPKLCGKPYRGALADPSVN